MSSSVAEGQAKVEEYADQAKDELTKLRAEYEELKKRTQPKVQEAENFLTSPGAIGFYQGFVVGAFVIMSYAKYKGGLQL